VSSGVSFGDLFEACEEEAPARLDGPSLAEEFMAGIRQAEEAAVIEETLAREDSILAREEAAAQAEAAVKDAAAAKEAAALAASAVAEAPIVEVPVAAVLQRFGVAPSDHGALLAALVPLLRLA